MFNKNVFDILSVDNSTYTYKSVNRLDVYGTTSDFQNKLGRVDMLVWYLQLMQ